MNKIYLNTKNRMFNNNNHIKYKWDKRQLDCGQSFKVLAIRNVY